MATVTWTGANATNTFSDGLNWDNLTGPASGDDVVFDGVFPVTGNDNCTWDVSTNFNTLVMTSGYTGVITATATINMTNTAGGILFDSSGTLDLNGQTLNCKGFDASGTATKTLTMGASVFNFTDSLNLSGASLTFNRDTSEFRAIGTTQSITMKSGVEFYALYLGKSGGGSSTITLGSDIVVNNVFNYNTDSGTRTINDNKVFILSDGINSASSGDTSGSTIFEFSGAVVAGWIPNATGGSCGNPVVINRSGTTLTFYGTIKHGGDFTYTAGTVDATTQTTNYQRVGTGNVDSNSMVFYDFSSATTGTTTLTSNLLIARDMTIGASTTVDFGSITINLGRNFSRTGTVSPSTSTFDFNAASGTITITGGFFATVNFNDGGSGPTYQLQNGMSCGALTIDSGATLDTKSGTNAPISSVGGSWTNNGTFTVNSSSVTLTGTGSSETIFTGADPFYNFILAGSGTYTLADALVIQRDFTSSVAHFDVDVTGNFQVTIGRHFVNSGGITPRAGLFLMNAVSGNITFDVGTTLNHIQFSNGGSNPVYQIMSNIYTTGNMTIDAGATLDDVSDSIVDVEYGVWTNNGTWVCRQGLFDLYQPTGNYTTDLGPDPFYNFELYGSVTTTYTLQRNLVIQNNFYIDDATINDNGFNMTVGGNWDNFGVYTASGSAIFNATSTGHTIEDGGSNWNIVRLNGSGGGWNFTNSTTMAEFKIDNGTLSGTNDITISSGMYGNGSVNLAGGTITIPGGLFGGNTAWTINNLITGGYFSNITANGSGSITGNDMTFGGSGSFDAGAKTWIVQGDLVMGDILNASTSTFKMTGTGKTITPPGTATTGPFYNLTIDGGVTSLVTSGIKITHALSILNSGIFDLNGQNITATGSTFTNNGILRLQGGETVTNLAIDTDSGEVAYVGAGPYSELAAGDSYFTISFDTGTWTLDNNLDVNGNLNLEFSSVLHAATFTINCAGDFNNNSGGFDEGTSTVIFDGTSSIGPNVDFYNLTFASGSDVTLASTGTFNVDASGTFTATTMTLDASTPSSQAILNVNGAQAVDHVTATDIDSSGGNTVIDNDGTITNTINWTAPVTTSNTNFLLMFA